MTTIARPVALLAALAFVTLLVAAPAPADHQPADKVAASGSALETMRTSLGEGESEPVTVLSATLRTSNPTDLVYQVALECALWTDVVTVGNDDETSRAAVEVWIEVDGEPVGVVSGDDGRVVFCDRAYRVRTTEFDDEDATIEQYLRTRSSHAFNWMDLNLGSGVHTVEVKAQLVAEATQGAFAKALVGKRTLVVEPTKLANDATL